MMTNLLSHVNLLAVTSEQRVLGSRVSCHRVRGRLGWLLP